MNTIKPELQVNNKNTLNCFFPIRTKDAPGVFDWDNVLGYVVRASYRKTIGKGSVEEFKNQCQKSFLEKLDESEFWEILEEMYFQGDELYKIAPEFLLFKAQKVKGNTPNSRLGELFAELLQDFFFLNKPQINLNFVEKKIYEEFDGFLQSGKSKNTVVSVPKEKPYLPFLSEHFRNDLHFLADRPKYLLSVFKDFLKLYAFLYTAQLSLNIRDWRANEPSSKPLYFILDNEKASDERQNIKLYGYEQVHTALHFIFPYLSMNESLQDAQSGIAPIWALRKGLEDQPYQLEKLNEYAQEFKENRELTTNIQDAENIADAIENLMKLGYAQFARGETRHEINTRYVKTVEAELCSHFVQSRGRAGKVLVFNQDYLVLLTNLAIGELEQLRFNELMKAFEDRGVFFDKQSQKGLIDFYERIGNVDRMSDSGDAVYVLKTI